MTNDEFLSVLNRIQVDTLSLITAIQPTLSEHPHIYGLPRIEDKLCKVSLGLGQIYGDFTRFAIAIGGLTRAGADAPHAPESNQDSPADASSDAARGSA